MLKKIVVATLGLSLLACQMEGDDQPESQEKPTNNSRNIIFNDVVSNHWQAATYDHATKEIYLEGVGASENSTWEVVNLNDSLYGKAFDVQFHYTSGYSDFAFFPSLASGSTISDFTAIDLTEYANGHLIYDFQILDFAEDGFGLFTHIECGDNCRSQYFPVANQTGVNGIGQPGFPIKAELNTWYEAKIPLAYFTNDNLNDDVTNLDLSKVTKLVITPPWASPEQHDGFRFQIDNLRFEK